jgi:ferric-dicitrate binding protein FerR (iron transport regulator)
VTELRCADVEARFVDAFDGRLDPAESVRFHSHIEGCSACRERAALWRALTPRLRDAVAPGPDAMATRRMQVEIERRLAGRIAPSPVRRWRAWWAPPIGVVAAAAAVVIWLRVGRPAPAVGYAAVVSVRGEARLGDGASKATARIPVGAPIALAAGAAVELALDSGAALYVDGPSRLALEGSARAVAVRLTAGKLSAVVAHRRPDETFAVVTNDLRVEVRGTRFSVTAGDAHSRVDVSEGQVAVQRSDGSTVLVSAGGSFDSSAAPAPLEAPAGDRSGALRSLAAPPSCATVVRSCQTTARAVRDSMRAGGSERALRQIAEARRDLRAGDAACAGSTGDCEDELRYLNAEALNQAGRLDAAVAAYRALDRRAAPSAMRQNALFAAAQIERRQGHLTAASADFERALAAAPRGALHEDALVGAMESARAAGETARARALAARYLDEFPRGLVAPAARKLVGDGPP